MAGRTRHRSHTCVWGHLWNEALRIKLPQLIVADPPGQHRNVIDVGIFDHRCQRVLSIACRKLTLDVLIPEIGQPLWRVCGTWPSEMADQEFQRPQMRQLSGLRVKVRAADAGKSVILFRVYVERYQRVRVQSLMNLCLS